ncbi:MAG: hypothetical protein ABSC94_31400 [Polyangiaceae bacterium]
MPEKVSIKVVDADHAVGVWGETLIQVWRGKACAQAFTAMNAVARILTAKAPGRATCLFIVEASSPPPDDAARRVLATFSREIVAKMAVAVVVAEGGGFRASIVRGVGIALTALMPHRVPFKFVNGVADAWQLLSPHLPGTDLSEMLDAARQVRGAIGSTG